MQRFRSVRARILAAFLVLLFLSEAGAVLATRQILLARTAERVDDALVQEVREFRLLVERGRNPLTGERFGDDVGAIFDVFLQRNVPGKVWASSNDNNVDKHLDLAQLAIERCKRKVEYGANIIVLMDSLTRLGRAFNTGGKGGGRTMSGGLDNRALEIPKKLFGAARKLENGGSLTIIATCLIDTGSRMDQVIFEEFKGTGNMELTLDRNLSNQRIFPALNITESGTRKEEKLMGEKELLQSRQIRRHLLNMPPAQSMRTLLDVLKKYPTNADLLSTIRV